MNGAVIENDELIGVHHVNKEKLIAFRLKEGEHLRMSQSGDGQVQTPRQDPVPFRPGDQVRNVVGDELFVEITPQDRRVFVKHFLRLQ